MTAATLPVPSAHATLALLRTRMRQRGNLPSFAKVVRAITTAMHSEKDRDMTLTQTVLTDPALTQQVLRLANSPMYAAFGQRVNTVTKAVMILGTDSIGHLALGMKLIDNLAAVSGNSQSAREELDKAILAGHIARKVTALTTQREDEEAVVCSMLHGLGRMLVAFYLPDEWLLLQHRTPPAERNYNTGARTTLGLGLDEVGEAIATQWGLPGTLVATMRDLPPAGAISDDRAGYLAALSTMSSDCADIMIARKEDAELLNSITSSYAPFLGVEPAFIHDAVQSAAALLEENSVEPQGDHARPSAPVPADILTRGLADMRASASHIGAGQLIAMALETMHEAFEASNTAVFLRNPALGHYAAKLVIGPDPEQRLSTVTFPETFRPDAFHAALANDKVILVENAGDAGFAGKLPAWWHAASQGIRSVVIVPLLIHAQGKHKPARQPIGLICCNGNFDHARLPDQNSVDALDKMRKLIADTLLDRA